MTSGAEERTHTYFRSRFGATAFGLASLLVGVGLLYSLVTNSTDLFIGVLLATLVFIAISLYVVFRRDGVLTAENGIIGVFVLVALGLFFGLYEFTALPSVVVIGVVIVVGVVIPNLVLKTFHES